jgi:hypothetical protein
VGSNRSNSAKEESEDSKGLIWIRKSKKRPHIDSKRTNNDLKNTYIKLKVE